MEFKTNTKLSKEIFRVTPEYQKLSKKKKKEILVILINWATAELTKQ